MKNFIQSLLAEIRLGAVVSYLCSIIGVIVAAYFSYVIYLRQRNLNRKRILRRMTYEVADTIRHIFTGLQILRQADNKQTLLPMHFKKMKIPEQSLFFNAEMIRYYPANHDRAFRKCALLLRNHNLELDAIISYVESVCGGRSFDEFYYRNLLGYYRKKSRLLLIALQHELCRLKKGKCKQCPLRNYNIFLPHTPKEDGRCIAEGLYNQDERCSIDAEAIKNWSPWYHNIPFLSAWQRAKVIRKHVEGWRAPNSVAGVIYAPST